MRKVLTRILTAVLVAGTTLTAVAAPPVMKKAKSAKGFHQLEMTAQAQPRQKKAKGRDTRLNHGLSRRQFASPSGLRSAAARMLPAAPARVQVPMKADASLPQMYGGVIYAEGWSQSYAPIGIYKLPSSTGGSFDMFIADADTSSGGVLVDGVYWATSYYSFWGMVFVDVTGYDFETGEKVATPSADIDNITLAADLDPVSGKVYAVTYNSDGDGIQFATIEYSDEAVVTTKIADFDENINSMAFDSTGQLYAFIYEGQTVGEGDNAYYQVTSSYLAKIDKATGAVTKVGDTGVKPQYLSDSAFDMKTNRLYWAVSSEDSYNGTLVEANLSTGAVSTVLSFPNLEEVTGLVIPKPAAEDKAPGAVTGLAADFAGGSLSGTVSFSAPSALFDGSAASGQLTYEVLCDGESVATGSTSYGAQVNASVTLGSSGEHTISAFCKNSAGDGPKSKIKVIAGFGVPKAPTVTAEYLDGMANVAWTPVTESANGGYIDAAEVTYTVTRYPDGVVVADKTKANTFSEPLAEPASITSYTYGVKASFGDSSSEEAMSNPIVLGNIVPPYTQTFDNSAALDGFTIIDANGDEKGWDVYDGAARMIYNTNLDMDDWLITPPMKLEAGKAYMVSFDARANSTTYGERIEAFWGSSNTVAGMTNMLVESTDLTSKDMVRLGGIIVPPADGIYYIGLHGISDADSYYLFVDNLEVEAGTSSETPAKVSDLAVTPGANGAKTATVSFKTPATTLSGGALSSLTKVEVMRGDELVKTFSSPAVNTALSFTDNLSVGGEYTYTVTAYNASGKGEPASASVFVGYDLPQAPADVKVVTTSVPGEVTVSWSAVTEDVNGMALGSDAVTYAVYTLDGYYRELVADNLTTTSYTYNAVPEGQDFVQYAVFAVTERGEGEGELSDMIPAGTPYDGLDATFADGKLGYIFGMGPVPDCEGDMGEWGIYTDTDFEDIASVSGDNGFLGMKGSYLDDGARLFTGMISLSSLTNPAFTFYVYNIVGNSPDINTYAVSVKEVGKDTWTQILAPTTISSQTDEEGWFKVTCNLSAYAGKTIQLAIDAEVKAYAYTFFDDLKVASMVDNDLKAAALNAPAKVVAGQDYTVSVSVSNEGAKEAEGYKVELFANNEKVAEKEGEKLASGDKTDVSFEMTMPVLATEPVTYKAAVVYAADENLTNNETADVAVAPIVSKLPAVSDLAAEGSENGVALSWSEPDLTAAAPEPVTDDFEDGDAFAAEYGNWTFADKDGVMVGGFQNMDLPGITPGETAGSFWVWDQSQLGNESFGAHSGTKYLFSLFGYEGEQVSDWAISPELYGGEQTVSFFAKSYSGTYPESITVYYSTTGKEYSDFTAIEGSTVAAVPGTWTEYNVELPEGAKYFAIESNAADAFMLMIDDVTYIPADGPAADLAIVGYDVYRNGVKVNSEPVAECEYLDADGKEGDAYQVVVVFNKGLSAGSNVAVATPVGLGTLTAGVSIAASRGLITVTGAEGLRVSIAAVDGKLIYDATGNANVAVSTGVYVVRAGQKTVKLRVR